MHGKKSVSPRGCARGFGSGALLAAAVVDLLLLLRLFDDGGVPLPLAGVLAVGVAAVLWPAGRRPWWRTWPVRTDAPYGSPPPARVFDSVAAELRRDGHHGQAVPLSGLQSDGPADVDRPSNLDTHIEQVAEIIDRSEEAPLALCGHSYGGRVHEIPVGHNIARRAPHGLAAVLGALNSPT